MRESAEAKYVRMTELEAALWAREKRVAGIDEVGRGPLAGPVMAGCVILPREARILGVDDSKKLSEAKREALYARILELADYARVGRAEVEEIEKFNILQATKLAMARAAEGAAGAYFLVDALSGLDLPGEQEGIVHGDASCYAIAAASIVAKVTRDRLMVELDARYPEYGFARNKGYGTSEHIEAIKRFGPCPAHRRSFITKWL